MDWRFEHYGSLRNSPPLLNVCRIIVPFAMMFTLIQTPITVFAAAVLTGILAEPLAVNVFVGLSWLVHGLKKGETTVDHEEAHRRSESNRFKRDLESIRSRKLPVNTLSDEEKQLTERLLQSPLGQDQRLAASLFVHKLGLGEADLMWILHQIDLLIEKSDSRLIADWQSVKDLVKTRSIASARDDRVV